MSREVMGSASDSGSGGSTAGADSPAPDLVLVPDEAGEEPRPTSVASPWATTRRVASLVFGSAVVAGLVGAGVTAALLRGGSDEPRVVAWLEFGDGTDYPGNDSVAMVLNVVNAGRGEVVVDAADLDGGLEVALDEPVRVGPGTHARQDVLVRVDDCGSRQRSVADDAGGTLRVSVTGADARSTWVTGSEVGTYPVTSGMLVQSVCDTGSAGPVETRSTSVSAEGELVMALRSTEPDAQVLEVQGPEGVRVTGQPSLPVTVPGRDEGTVTVAMRLVVDDCTDEVERLDAADQVRFVVDGQDVYDYDFVLVHSWYVREVTRVCG